LSSPILHRELEVLSAVLIRGRRRHGTSWGPRMEGRDHSAQEYKLSVVVIFLSSQARNALSVVQEVIKYTSVHPYCVILRTRWSVIPNSTTLTMLQQLVPTCDRSGYTEHVHRYDASSLGYDTGSIEVGVLWFKDEGNHCIIHCYQNSAFIFITTKRLRLTHCALSFYVLLILRCKRSVLKTTVIYNQVYEAGCRVNHGTKW